MFFVYTGQSLTLLELSELLWKLLKIADICFKILKEISN